MGNILSLIRYGLRDDNKSLKKLVIDIPGINKHDEVTLSGTEYEYSEEYTFPSEDRCV